MKEPTPRRPGRHALQEALVRGLTLLTDEDAMAVLAVMWGELDGRAPDYPELREMLEKAERFFPRR